MRWITLGAIAATLGVLLARGVDERPSRLARSAAPRFGSLAEEPTRTRRPDANGEAPSRKPNVGEPRVAEKPPRRVENTDPAELARAGTWRKTLSHHAQWGDTRDQLAATSAHLRRALDLAENPIARQNIIFLTVRTLPLKDARAVLLPLLESGPGGDGPDVVSALAFAGDLEMLKRLKTRVPAAADVSLLVDTLFEVELLEASASEPARATLRSYRSFEVLAGSEYFRIADESSAWFAFPDPGPEDAVLLWKLWLELYPGHPGSDDAAIEIGAGYSGSRNGIEAARWYDRAACLPDQFRTSKALRLLLFTVERKLTRTELDSLLRGELFNPLLLQYVALRRTAAEDGCAAALTRLRRFTERNPGNVLAEAWRSRDGSLPPGFASGPLKLGSVHDRIAGDRTDHDRLFPPREAMRLSMMGLARQFGLWERVAELERRLAAAEGESAAPVLLEIGKITLAEPDLFFPVYARRTFEAGEFLGISRRRSESRWDAWLQSTVHAARAMGVFRTLERTYPEFARGAGVRRYIGQAQVALANFEPLDSRPRDREAGE